MARLRFLAPVLAFPLVLWAAGALLLGPYAGSTVRALAAGLFLALVLGFAWTLRKLSIAVVSMAAAAPALLVAAAWPFLTGSPRNDRPWRPEQERLTTARIEGDVLTVSNLRNFRWKSLEEYEAAWEERTYDLSKLVRVWFVLVPFHYQDEVAHTFLSFEFEDGQFLAASPEIRKEQGESFSATGGLFRNYELYYVVGDERDVVKIRTDFFGDEVFVYPVRTSRENARKTLEDVMARVNALAAKPEWYDALTNSCAVNVARHANAVVPGRVPASWRVALPGWSDELALELGLIDFDGTVEEARARFKVNDLAVAAGDAPDFSQRIRALAGVSRD